MNLYKITVPLIGIYKVAVANILLKRHEKGKEKGYFKRYRYLFPNILVVLVLEVFEGTRNTTKVQSFKC